MQMELASKLGSMQIQCNSLLNKLMVANDRIEGLKSSSNNWMWKKFSMPFDDPRLGEPEKIIDKLKTETDQEVEVELKHQQNLDTLETQMVQAQESVCSKRRKTIVSGMATVGATATASGSHSTATATTGSGVATATATSDLSAATAGQLF
jgi:hypothetical protein